MSKARLADAKQILMGLASLGMAVTAITNLYYAIAYGAVFLVRSHSGWVYLGASPAVFVLSVIVSLIVGPLCALFGVVLITNYKEERRAARELVSRSLAEPRYEDSSHTFKIKE